MQGRSCRPARFWEVCLPTEAPLEAEARVRTWRKKYSSYLAGYVHSNLCPIALGTSTGYFSSRNESKRFCKQYLVLDAYFHTKPHGVGGGWGGRTF